MNLAKNKSNYKNIFEINKNLFKSCFLENLKFLNNLKINSTIILREKYF